MGIRADIGLLIEILLIKRIVFLKNFVWSCYSSKFRSLLVRSVSLDGVRWTSIPLNIWELLFINRYGEGIMDFGVWVHEDTVLNGILPFPYDLSQHHRLYIYSYTEQGIRLYS